MERIRQYAAKYAAQFIRAAVCGFGCAYYHGIDHMRGVTPAVNERCFTADTSHEGRHIPCIRENREGGAHA